MIYEFNESTNNRCELKRIETILKLLCNDSKIFVRFSHDLERLAAIKKLFTTILQPHQMIISDNRTIEIRLKLFGVEDSF